MSEVASRYHEATNHSCESVRRRARPLDWANRPSVFKRYPELPLEPIPPELDPLLRLGAGVARRRRRYEFRTYSSAGALYPIELYVASAGGLFYFHPRDLGLKRLRDEDVRDAFGGGETLLALTGISDARPGSTASAATGICSGTPARCSPTCSSSRRRGPRPHRLRRRRGQPSARRRRG